MRSGRALEHLPAVAAGVRRRGITAGQVARDRRRSPDEPNSAPPPPSRASTSARSTRRWSRSRTAAAHAAAGAGGAPLPGPALDPDGPEPDPTEGRRLTVARHADGRGHAAGSSWTRWAGRRCRPRSSRSCRPPAPRAMTAPGRSSNADALVQLCRQPARRRAACRRCARGKPHVVVRPRRRRPRRPAPRPRRGATGFGARSPPPAPAGWPATAHPRIVMVPRRASRWTWAGTSGSSRRTSAGRRAVATGTASSPAATPRPTGATCTTCSSGSTVEATGLENSGLVCERHQPRCITASGSSDDPVGRWRTWRPDGTEIAHRPTAAGRQLGAGRRPYAGLP